MQEIFEIRVVTGERIDVLDGYFGAVVLRNFEQACVLAFNAENFVRKLFRCKVGYYVCGEACYICGVCECRFLVAFPKDFEFSGVDFS